MEAWWPVAIMVTLGVAVYEVLEETKKALRREIGRVEDQLEEINGKLNSIEAHQQTLLFKLNVLSNNPTNKSDFIP